MKLLVANDAHILRTPDGRHWVKSIYGYDFWKRYLDVFEEVRIVARLKDVEFLDRKYLNVDGDGIEIYGIPFYQGPFQLLKNYIKIQKSLKGIDNGCDVAILRMPSQTAYMVYTRLRKGIIIGGEIVYDLYDDVKQKNKNLFIKMINLIISNRLKKFCMKANGVSYVTKKIIQKHYPAYSIIHGEDNIHFDTYYSSVSLNKEAFFYSQKFMDNNSGGMLSNQDNLKYNSVMRHFTLIMSDVSMNSERKGERTLIGAVKIARDKGYDVYAVLIGDGKLRKDYENYAEKLGIKKYIRFTGLLTFVDEVREELKRADIYVFPSNGEGLPRGILEAMAVGLPVLSTPVGGIPEIIESRYLLNPLDVEGFANEICRLMNHRKELEEMSKKNYKKSLEFENEILQKRRNEFYSKLLNLAKSQ